MSRGLGDVYKRQLLTEGAVLRYLVGSYNALAEAGLFRTLLAGE